MSIWTVGLGETRHLIGEDHPFTGCQRVEVTLDELHEPTDLPIGGGRDALSRFFHLSVKLLSDGLPIQCHGRVRSSFIMPEPLSNTHPILAEQILTKIPALYDKSLGALLTQCDNGLHISHVYINIRHDAVNHITTEEVPVCDPVPSYSPCEKSPIDSG